MEYKLQEWLKKYRAKLAKELGPERYAGNQGVRKGKGSTQKQRNALKAGQKVLAEKRRMQREVRKTSS